MNDFKRQYVAIEAAVDAAVKRVLAGGWYIMGAECEAFEAELAAALGAGWAVGVANGTEAIALALMALEIGPGDEVLTTSLSAYPTITGIRQAGATPVVVDIEADTGLIDPAAVAAALTARTRAILPVHLYGQAADLDPLLRLAAERGIPIVEDAAQSILATWQGRMTGTIGALGCLSFYPTKNLGAAGDAGAVVGRDPALREKLLRLRNYGQSRRYYHDEAGLNSRLDELQAAILRVKLRHLGAWTARRREIARRYRAALADHAIAVRAYGEPCWHLFPLLLPARERFMAAMTAAGVQTLIHYPVPLHRQGAFQGRAAGKLDRVAAFADRVVSLPIFPELTDEEVGTVIAAARAASADGQSQ